MWNDDTIPPQTGFPPHPHRDMEIITYVREGAITHRDNLGNAGRTEAGDVQVMSAGTGVQHGEYNLEDEPPASSRSGSCPTARRASRPGARSPFPKDDRAGRFVTLASGMAGDEGALPIRANARVSGVTVKAGETVGYSLAPGRHAYLVPATGRVEVNGVEAEARDGVAVRDVAEISVTALEDSEIILVDAA